MSRYSLRHLCLLLICSTLLPGSALYAHQDLLLQIEQLGDQISSEPQNTALLIKRGDLYRRHGDWNAAETDFQKAREMSPGQPIIDWYEGRLLVESGQYEEGIVMLTRLLEQEGQHGGAYRVRAKAYWHTQQALLAAQDYQRAVNNSERPSPSLYRSLVLSLVGAGAEYTDEAIQAVNDGLNHFAGEITLLGLGVDLSLSQKNALQAQGYRENVPSRLAVLPQWQFRQVVLDCVKGDVEGAAERLSLFITTIQGNDPQRAGTWQPPLDIINRLIENTSVDECSRAAWETLRNQQP